eukprot:GHRR01021326.1.p1 GENE.GHRR01021326.1~~GHRR01021326.1.p1  ORF type:complete len:777 (+),score=379.23 GHRR01021326.1:752-3082(+)
MIAAAAATLPGSAAIGTSDTALEAAFSASAAAAVGVSAMLASRSIADSGLDLPTAAAADSAEASTVTAGFRASSRVAGWLAHKLGVADAARSPVAAGAAGEDVNTHSGCQNTGWRLVLLAERTPAQLVQVHLRCHDWGSALHISRAYGLDTDAVYRARWAASPVSRGSISDNLPRLKDRQAVIAECLTRAAPDYESARSLISYGLRESAKWAAPPPAAAAAAATAASAAPHFATPGRPRGPGGGSSGSSGRAVVPPSPEGFTGIAGSVSEATAGVEASAALALTAEVVWWRAQRLKLLQLNDKLETAVALNCRRYDPAIFEALRNDDPQSAAAALAATGNVSGLQVMLQRHRAALQPLLLPLLAALPESVDPRTYSTLIPRANGNTDGSTAHGSTAVQTPARGNGMSAAAATRQAAAAASGTKPVGIGNMDPASNRRVDWVESDEMLQVLAAISSGNQLPTVAAAAGAVGYDGSSGSAAVQLRSMGSLHTPTYQIQPHEVADLMHATEEMERLLCSSQQRLSSTVDRPFASEALHSNTGPSDQEVATWFATKALQIDHTTGQLPSALQLLELAASKGYGDYAVDITNCIQAAIGSIPAARSACSSSSSIGGYLIAGSRTSVCYNKAGVNPAAAESAEIAADSHTSAAAEVVSSSSRMTLATLLVQARVLLALVYLWWPEQQQQQSKQHNHYTTNPAATNSELANRRAPSDAGQQAAEEAHSDIAAATTAVAAATSALPLLWSITLVDWVSAGLLPQLLVCFGNSNRESLQHEFVNR